MNKVVDIHSHIIPNIDDGSKSIEMTFKMINQAIENEVYSIVATPHYRVGICQINYQEVREKVNSLNRILKNKIQIYVGQEIYFTEKLLEDFANGEIGTINDSRYMLIELSSRKFDENFIDVIYELKLRGIVPIIAHPERYLYIQKNFECINKLIDEECLFQLDAGSLSGMYGKSAEHMAIKLIKNNIYNFIGSDSHNLDNRRNYIKQCLNKIEKINREFIEYVKRDSTNLLLDKDIEFRGKKIEKKNIISNFLKDRRGK